MQRLQGGRGGGQSKDARQKTRGALHDARQEGVWMGAGEVMALVGGAIAVCQGSVLSHGSPEGRGEG